VEKILEVGDQRSIRSENIFCNGGDTKHWHCICHSCFIFIVVKFSLNENSNGEPKELHFSLRYKKISQKILKSPKDMLKSFNFRRSLGGQPREGGAWTS
jgi:hypothetical protein